MGLTQWFHEPIVEFFDFLQKKELGEKKKN